MYRYVINIYSGRVYCGNGYFDTLGECMKFLEDDGFCDKAKIFDSETGVQYTIKVKYNEIREAKE